MEKKKILIAEDDGLVRETLAHRFRDEGFYVTAVPDGGAAIDTALLEHPDIILLDIIMPVTDGMTVLSTLRKDEWGKSVPVILLTNLSDSSKVAEAISHGVYDYLVKSDWKLESLVTKVKGYFPDVA